VQAVAVTSNNNACGHLSCFTCLHFLRDNSRPPSVACDSWTFLLYATIRRLIPPRNAKLSRSLDPDLGYEIGNISRLQSDDPLASEILIKSRSVLRLFDRRSLGLKSMFLAADEIYTGINFTRYSVTEVGALSAAGWAWSLHGKHTCVAGWAQRVSAPRLGAV